MVSVHGHVLHPHLPHLRTGRRRRSRSAGTSSWSVDALRVVTLGLTVVFGLVAITFVVGEAMTAPGGWAGLGLSASWLLPSAILAVLAWRHPDAEAPVLAAATGALVVLAAWAVVPAGGWEAAESTYGPVRAVATVAATCVLGLYGWRRPRLAGELLMLVAVTPVVGLVLGSMLSALLGVGGVTWQLPTSMAVVSLPAAALGGLHLLIGSATGHAEEGEPAS